MLSRLKSIDFRLSGLDAAAATFDVDHDDEDVLEAKLPKVGNKDK